MQVHVIYEWGFSMGEGNLLNSGVQALQEMQEKLSELYEYQAKQERLAEEEKRLADNIQEVEKALANEVQTTVKKRRKEIEDTFETQIGKVKAKIKKAKDRRDKNKELQVSDRIDSETVSLREENYNFNKEIKSIYKQNHIPSIFNTKLFYALYFPRIFTDFILLLAILLIMLLVIPCSIYYFLLPEEKILYLILIYLVVAAVSFGLYMLIGNKVKDKHLERFQQIKQIRENIRLNQRKIAVIKRNIKRDRDESVYDLEDFDKEIEKLEMEAKEINTQKEEALATFDKTTSHVIVDDIENQYKEKTESLKSEHKKISSDYSDTEEKIKALTLQIANEYEPYIGKDLMTLDHLMTLINIIQAGNANTISEAIAYYKKSMDELGSNH